MRAVSAFLLSAATLAVAQPPTPVWPNAFAVQFNESAALLGPPTLTTGALWLSADPTSGVVLERIDRATGKGDRYCSSVRSDDSPCTHLVVPSAPHVAGPPVSSPTTWRWLIWPELNDCCACCDAASGCGAVSPNWLVEDKATYYGRSTIEGVPADGWLAYGLQANYYWATTDAQQAPLALWQIPDDNMTFFGYQPGAVNASLFALPSYCKSRCPLLSICTVA